MDKKFYCKKIIPEVLKMGLLLLCMTNMKMCVMLDVSILLLQDLR